VKRWEDFSTEEMGIYVADAVARGRSNQLPVRCPEYTIPASLIVPFFVPNGEWHLTKEEDSSPILTSLTQIIDAARLERYLVQRDRYRQVDGREEYWADTDIRMAMQCTDRPRTIAQKRFNMIVIYDKMVHGRNKAKQTKIPGDALCPLCHQPETQAHILVDCRLPRLALIRAFGRRQWRDFYVACESDPLTGPLVENMDRCAWSNSTANVERFWLGTHDTDSWMRVVAPYKNRQLSGSELTSVLSAFQKATTILRRIANQIITERRTMYWELYAEARKREWHAKRASNYRRPITSFPGFRLTSKLRLNIPPLLEAGSTTQTGLTQTRLTNFFPFTTTTPLNVPAPAE
jgi:hypothetical protein